jgi:HAD superfamily hydrolase (TIGR01549 family)
MEYELCRPYQGAEDLIRDIHSLGKFNYLYTHRGKSSITFLKNYELEHCFTDFITSQHGFERKPSPNAIHYLIDKYQMMPEEAIMIGDRDLDILAAKNAGIHSCFFDESGAKSMIADFSISSMKELYSIIKL